jgi:PilZ domain
MQATGDAKAQASEKAPKKKERGKGTSAPAGGADGPSVAAHPRAAVHVARAKGWGGLIGFLLGGYLSLPTSTLAAAGLRALVAGIACYLAAWAGAVFVWRQLMTLQIAAARDRARPRAESSAPGSRSGVDPRLASARAPDPTQQRENVRVAVQCPVIAYVGAKRSRVQTFTIDVSAGGLLVSGLEMLGEGEPFEFQLTLAAGTPPVTGTGTVVRTDPQGRCAVAFQRISDEDQKRLIQFVFDRQRSEREGA